MSGTHSTLPFSATRVLSRPIDAVRAARSLCRTPAAVLGLAVLLAALAFAMRAVVGDVVPATAVSCAAVVLAVLFGGPAAGFATVAVDAVVSFLAPMFAPVVAAPVAVGPLLGTVAVGLLIGFAAAIGEVLARRAAPADDDRATAERRHRAMIDGLHEGVILFSVDGRLIAANPSAERILRVAPGTLAADTEVFGSWTLLREDGTAMTVAEYPAVRVAATGEPVTDVLIGVPIDGDVVWLLNNATPLRDPATGRLEGVVVSFVDVGERRRARRALEENRAELRSIVEVMQAGVMVFDRTGCAVSCNASAERILRRSAAELLGAPGFLAHGRRVVREDGSDFPVDERPIRRVVATGRPQRDVIAGICDESGTFWLHLNAEPVLDEASGTTKTVVASFVDITELRRREVELAESRARLASIFAAVHEGIVVFAPDGRILKWNPSAERLLHLDATTIGSFDDAFAQRRLLREDGTVMPLDDYPAVRTLKTGEAVFGEIIGAPIPDGTKWLLVNSQPIRDPETGEVRAAVVSLNDVSAGIEARRQIEESRARFASIVESAMDAVISVDADQRIVLFNTAAERILGVSCEEALGTSIERFVPEAHRAAHRHAFGRFASEERVSRPLAPAERPTAVRADGEVFPIEASISRAEIDGRPLFTIVMRDISERVAAERLDAKLATVVRSSPDAIFTVSIDGRIETWNEAAARIFGYTAEEAVGQPIGLLSFPDRPIGGTEIYRRVLAGETVRHDVVRRHKDGSAIHVSSAAAPLRDATGRVVAGVVILSDITERVSAARRLGERDEQLRQTLDATGLGVWWIDTATGLVHCDRRSRTLFGVRETETLDELAGRLVAEDAARLRDVAERMEPISADRPLIVRRAVGTDGVVWLALSARLGRREGGGVEVWGTVKDVSEARRAEEMAGRFEASKRLEALGRMTGGIAHDLNNLLTVVSGNLQLFEMAPEADGAGRWIAEALRAIESGAMLNSRLLTFARKRRLEPMLVDLNFVVGTMIDMFRRVLDPEISISCRLADAVGPVRVDPAEIENALINLVFNARDAMPTGGDIRIETQNTSFGDGDLPPEAECAAGDFVRLTVSDDGTGMAPDVRDRAFEPFFTTKGAGRGTGLGLASLYGFVKQMGGFVTLYSEVGRGTVVNVFLPRRADEAVRRAETDRTAIRRGQGQTVLVVDDDPDVRRVTRERLETLGYRTVSAADAAEASATIASGAAIDLVFTDVVMPGGRSGLDFARELRAADPDRRILVCSGYAGDLLGGGPEVVDEFRFLRKPYSIFDLANSVAAALEA
jgi:PAS domain S-box-containing protein